MEGQKGFEIQTRENTDSKELVSGQEVILKTTVNHDIHLRFSLCALVSVDIILQEIRSKSKMVRSLTFSLQR
jgi:hypothetical protein